MLPVAFVGEHPSVTGYSYRVHVYPELRMLGNNIVSGHNTREHMFPPVFVHTVCVSVRSGGPEASGGVPRVHGDRGLG